MPEGNEGEGNGGQPTPSQGTKIVGSVFTQEQLDAILRDRLAREGQKFADYDALKAKAAQFDSLEASKKDELTKLSEAKLAAEQERDQAKAGAASTLKRASIIVEAARQNAQDPEVLVAILAASSDIKVEGDEVKGAKEAVEKLLKEKPFLAKGTPSASGGQFGGNDPSTVDERIAALEAAGKFSEARDLKIQKMAGLAK